LTDLEWAVLEPLLAKKGGRGKPPTIEKRALLNAIFHVARTGTPGRTFRTSRHNLARRRESDENPQGGVRRHLQPISPRAEAQRRTSAMRWRLAGSG
jgi:transposase